MVFLNILWVLLQIPIVTGPPATAVLYAISQKAHDEELWELQELWPMLRHYFWPAWKWAIPNLLVGVALLGNFYQYQAATGNSWVVLRLVWGVVAVVWFMLNLFYWPFYLAQNDQSLTTTYANSGRFLLLNPWSSLFLALCCALVLYLSARMTIPLMVGVACWVVLVSITAVQEGLRQKNKG